MEDCTEMSDVPQGHTAETLVPLSDDEIADRAVLPSWTLTEALFWLGGYRSPGYESTRHMQDHFWSAYIQARLAFRQGVLCQKTVEAGVTIFFDSPAHWLAWADKIGPGYIKVDERMRRALSQKAGATVPTADAPQPDAGAPQPRREKQVWETKERQERTHDVEAEALLGNRIKAVIAKAKAEWPDPGSRPGANEMARRLVEGQPKSKVGGFGQEAIRKILAGTYKPAKDRGIPGLGSR